MRSSGCRTPTAARPLRISIAPGSPAGYSPTLSVASCRARLPSQSALGVGVSLDELVPGDLLFWGSGSGVYHVGIYAGDGEYIHASTGGGRVMRATFDYFAPDFAKRVIE